MKGKLFRNKKLITGIAAMAIAMSQLCGCGLAAQSDNLLANAGIVQADDGAIAATPEPTATPQPTSTPKPTPEPTATPEPEPPKELEKDITEYFTYDEETGTITIDPEALEILQRRWGYCDGKSEYDEEYFLTLIVPNIETVLAAFSTGAIDKDQLQFYVDTGRAPRGCIDTPYGMVATISDNDAVNKAINTGLIGPEEIDYFWLTGKIPEGYKVSDGVLVKIGTSSPATAAATTPAPATGSEPAASGSTNGSSGMTAEELRAWCERNGRTYAGDQERIPSGNEYNGTFH